MCRVWRVGVTRDYLFEIRHENETRERYIYNSSRRSGIFESFTLLEKPRFGERRIFLRRGRKILNWENKYKGGKENEILVLGGNLI